MYLSPNFKSKKAAKEALAAGKRVSVFTTSPFETVPADGKVSVCGPHYPEPHKWYGTAKLVNGTVTEIK